MHQRVKNLRKLLEKHKLDALLISSLVNIRYLFGFTGSNAIALITSGLSFFVTDRRYRQQVQEQVKNAEIIIAPKDLVSELKKIAVVKTAINLGIEAMHLTVKEYSEIKKALPNVKIFASERIVERIASIKDEEEIENIRRAASICGGVIEEIKELITAGVSELDLSAEISYRTKINGSEKDPFEPIVASGKRSALPHGISSKKVLEEGDLIIIDFGAVVNGYAADLTRTLILGEPSPRQKEMIQAVHGALQVSENAARPGLTGKELDKVARDFLAEKGYGEFFQHSLGHGLGLDVHELPRIGEFSGDKIAAGNVITLEPGVYVPEFGGVRIEDDFVVTQNGIENLTPFPREVVSVG